MYQEYPSTSYQGYQPAYQPQPIYQQPYPMQQPQVQPSKPKGTAIALLVMLSLFFVLIIASFVVSGLFQAVAVSAALMLVGILCCLVALILSIIVVARL